MSNTKSVMFVVRMSEAERKRLRRLARMHNQSMAEWVRAQIIIAPIEGRSGRMVLADEE